ncbi:MAG: YraN family protein [Anaerolineaceae bacterium]|jgi:putative endonuclease
MPVKNNYSKQFGNWGEKVACEYLEEKGIRIVATNIHSRSGEIDILAQDEYGFRLIEVKTRSNSTFGKGEESVSKPKIDRIIATWELYKLKHPDLPENAQIDVIVIEKKARKDPPVITYLENVNIGASFGE